MAVDRPQGQVEDLQRLVRARFPDFDKYAAELKLVSAAPLGFMAYCGPTEDHSDLANRPASADSKDHPWGADRQIRAELIRWLCVDRRARDHVDPRGIQVLAARITGDLDLSFVALPFPLRLECCSLTNGANLSRADIAQLALSGTWLQSLDASEIRVKSSVFLNDGFRAAGAVQLPLAQIGGNLECGSGEFINPGADAIELFGAKVEGDVQFSGNCRAAGRLSLTAARIGSVLDFSEGLFSAATLDLRDASASALMDDERSWPCPGCLLLNGFVYGRFSKGPTDAESRLKWLNLQESTSFKQQPYLQLAKVLRESGDDDGERRVLVAMEDHRLKTANSYAYALSYPLKLTAGYGYRPLLAFWELVGLSALGWIVYRRSYLAGNMVPTDKEAYQSFKSDGQPPAHYRSFAPVIYAVENSLPLVKLGQGDKWQPEPSRESAWSERKAGPAGIGRLRDWKRLCWLQRFLVFCGLQSDPDPERRPSRLSRRLTSPRFLRWFLWIQILLGWLLATLFLAGVTGIVRK